MNIILFGYRGCGKTSMGRLLADQLWKKFVDVDDEICRRFENKTVAQIWQDHGEPAYRQVEVEVTRDLCSGDEQVIALGGGTLMQPGAREAVEQAKAVRIYLYCETDELNRRIEADPRTAATRPQLTAHGGGRDEVEAVLKVRDPVYREVADRVFDVTHLNVEDGVRYLIQKCM